MSMYGPEYFVRSEGILLAIHNIKQQSYVFYDALDDDQVRGGKRLFMLGVIAPKINYLESMRIRDIFEDLIVK